MKNKKNVVLIILNYNDSDTTIRLVESVYKYNSIDRIIIVDNLSKDDSLHKLFKLQTLDKIDVIQTVSNGGFASGNNYGIRYAIDKYEASYVMVSNPDVEFDEATILAMISTMEANQTIGIVAPRMLNASGKPVKTAWELPGYWACVRECCIVANSIYDRVLRNKKSYASRLSSAKIVLQGSLFMMSVTAYKAVGGMDEGTFLYYEENILAHKLYCHGFTEKLISDFSYIHRHSESIDKSIKNEKAKFSIMEKSREYYCEKYLGTGPVRIRLLRVIFDIGLMNFLICRRIQNIFRTIKKNN